MSDRLAQEGWRWPADPGPRRAVVVRAVLLGVLLLGAWSLLGTGWLQQRGEQPRRIVVDVDAKGRVKLDGTELRTELRRRGQVRFVVARGTAPSDRPLDVDLDGEIEPVIVRTWRPLDGADAVVLIEVPEGALGAVASAMEEAGPLRTITEPLDARVRETRDQRHLQERVQRAARWLAPLSLIAFVVLPLVLWRRAGRRFASMRRPGPGAQLGVEPPSSLDPIGAALLVAGTHPVDAGAAFAGHVLDLVERKQLPLRRSVALAPGVGTLVGLHHADEVQDIAVALLQGLLVGDDTSLLLPDAATADAPRLDAVGRRRWHEHVAERAGFERLLEAPRTRRLRAAVLASAGVFVGSGAWAALTGPGGTRAIALWVSAVALLTASVLAMWGRDARRWRVVVRERRVERAQWLAWCDAAGSTDPHDGGPASDLRNLPVLVAIGAPRGALRPHVGADAVDLAAVSARTVDVLTAIAR